MSGIDRRRVLGLGLGAAALTSADRLAAHEAAPRRDRFDSHALYPNTQQPRLKLNPVSFWNDVSLQLVALDHSIDARDSRAPGPCATARALGLVHIVMADAVAAAYPVDFEGFYVRRVQFSNLRYAEVFVGGAVAWILEYIYNTPAHTQLIGAQRLHFLKQYDQQAGADWTAGLTFARNVAFTSRWDWDKVKYAALQSSRLYQAGPKEHRVDPHNPDQKYYGVVWGEMEPLVPQLRIASLGAGPPPDIRERVYIRDAHEVREIGAYRPDGPSRDQVQKGLFWAYCGVRLIGPPQRLYNQVIRQIIESDGLSIPEMARALALCNIALADAGIVAWEEKYRYRVWRPVVALRHYFDRDWRPFGSPRTNPTQFALGSDTQFRLLAESMLGGGSRGLNRPAKDTLPYPRACFTPNFPSYPSGHAAFASACFTILKLVRGENPDLRSDPGRLDHDNEFVSDELNGVSIDNFRNEARPYVPLRYRHIDHMIEDNGRARVYLGVHWNFDSDRGNRSGAEIARAIYRHVYQRRGPAEPEPEQQRRWRHRHAPEPEAQPQSRDYREAPEPAHDTRPPSREYRDAQPPAHEYRDSRPPPPEYREPQPVRSGPPRGRKR